MKTYRMTYELAGDLRGRGFRDAIALRANDHGIGGFIRHQGETTILIVEGAVPEIGGFIGGLHESGDDDGMIMNIAITAKEEIPPGQRSTLFLVLE